ncbi:MAG: VanZ family protein [Eubacteriales bacterium]
MTSTAAHSRTWKLAILILFCVYTAALLLFAFLRFSPDAQLPLGFFIRAHTNLIPGATVASYISRLSDTSINPGTVLLALTVPLCSLFPLGVFLSWRLGTAHRFPLSLSIAFLAVTVLDTLRLLTKRGSFDVDDIILSLIGFSLGYLLVHAVRRVRT